MSMFDSRSQAQYTAALLKFLRAPRGSVLPESGITKRGAGRRPNYKGNEIRILEDLVNVKAARCEAVDTTVGERIKIARDYLGLRNSQISRRIGVSRELVRRWVNNLNRPTDESLKKLADVLNVPLPWLEHGGAVNLAADSHLGVRVGELSLKCRETLFSLTLNVLEKEANCEDPEKVADALSKALETNSEICNAARKSGGRWEVIEGQLSFIPWIPLELEPLKRRHWPDETEVIINEELESKATVYSAWKAVKERCEALCLSYPKRVSLHKRVQKVRTHVERFGLALKH